MGWPMRMFRGRVPISSWRGFAGEVGIIVLGVLIAIGAQGLAEDWQWQQRSNAADETLTQSYATLAWLARERDQRSYCLVRQLKDIALAIDKADATGRLEPLGAFGTVPPRRPWHVDSWEALVSSGVVTHMPRDKQVEYGSIVTFVGEVNEIGRSEFGDWDQLATMVGPGRSLSDVEAAMLRKALSSASSKARLLRHASLQIETQLLATGLPIEQAISDPANGFPPIDRRKNRDCRPTGPVPSAYNYSIFQDIPLEGSTR